MEPKPTEKTEIFSERYKSMPWALQHVCMYAYYVCVKYVGTNVCVAGNAYTYARNGEF